MIDHLTDAQVAKFPEYVNKWIAIGLSTSRLEIGRTKQIIENLYTHLLKKPIVPVIIRDSPLSAWIAVCIISLTTDKQIKKRFKDYSDKTFFQLVDTTLAHVLKNPQPNPELLKELVDSGDFEKIKELTKKFVHPYIDGSFSAGYFSFYDYIENELSVKYDAKAEYDAYKATTELGFVYPLDEACVVAQKPEAIHLVNSRLHNPNGPAVKYTDGFQLYSLNGVRVPDWLVETPANELKAEALIKSAELKNVEVRREFIRKIGIERCLAQLHAKVINKEGDYELLQVNVIDNSPRTYLKMRNPSVPEVWHVEAVAPQCETVQQALNWRRYQDPKKSWKPTKIT
jgi:hypothetical protein